MSDLFDRTARVLATLDGLAILAGMIVAAYVAGLFFWSRKRRSPGAIGETDGAARLGSVSRDRHDPGASLGDIPTWATARGRSAFIGIAAVSSGLVWLVALVLAPDQRIFLTSREWHAQPLYLLAHVVTLRLFASILATNFIAGAQNLDLGGAQAGVAVRRMLGWRMMLPAILIALPFIAVDLRFFLSARYPKLSGLVTPTTADWLMFAIWTVEWLLNAVVWAMLIGFLCLNVWALGRHAFKAPIHVVLMERHYRPFLRMSAQGASVVLAFSIVTALYILYAGGELTDYAGLIVTIALLAVCFLPPWFLLRRRVRQVVQRDVAILQGAITPLPVEHLVEALARKDADPTPHVCEALVMMRVQHLERLYDDVGRREATEVTLRLLAPAATVGWQFWQHGGAVLAKVGAWLAR